MQGRQFYWQFVYPNGAISINELRLPVDRVTTLKITAPVNDVIHSFWAPALGPKRDAIPGRVNTLKLKPLDEGSYEIRCAELCGLQHAVMDGTVVVVPAAQYTAWVDALGAAQKTKAGRLALGKEIFQGACATCHGLSGEGLVGPPARRQRRRHEHARRRADSSSDGAVTRCPRSGRAGATPSFTR